MKLELTRTQLFRVDNGEIVKVIDANDNVIRVMKVNDEIKVIKFDASKPMFTKALLNESNASTLQLTGEETKELLSLRENNVNDYAVYRSSGYKATMQELETIKAKLTNNQYLLDSDYIKAGKVASVKAQQLLGKARKVIVNTKTLDIISDNNATYQVIDSVELI